MRNAPTISTETLKGVNPRGARGTVTSGPRTGVSNSTWYDINFDIGYDGWVVSDNYNKVTGTAAAEQTTPSYFKVGDPIRLFRRANVRSTAGILNNLVRVADANSLGTITNGPTRVGTANWYRVDFESGTDGWVVSDNYVLVPAPTTGGGGGSTGGGNFPPFAGSGNKPGTGNTGPKTTNLQSLGGRTISANGTVLENFTMTGTLVINASNVTIRNFRILNPRMSSNTSPFYCIQVNGSNVVIEDGEITGSSNAAVTGSGFTARRLNIHDTGGDAFKPQNNFVIESCYIHRMGTIPEKHADGIQMTLGSNGVIRYNHFDMVIGQGGYINSICTIIQTDQGRISNITVDHNWYNGGGYSIQVNDKGSLSGGAQYGPPTNVRIVNNTFTRNHKFGPIRVANKHSTFVFSGNKYEDGTPI